MCNDHVIIECWNDLLIEKDEIPPIVITAGSTLHHGARRGEGEVSSRNGNWLWTDHWYTEDKKYARSYAQSWCDGTVDHAMLEVEPFRNLNMLNLTGISFNELCQQAIDKYGIRVVGHADWPIRKHLKATLKNLFGDKYQGYAEYDAETGTILKEVFVFDYFHNLIYSKEPEIIVNETEA
jgi:hypothetical protein